MSNRQRKSHQGLSTQPLLFATNLEEGAFDISLGFRQLLTRTIRACDKDRYQIAGEVSRLAKTSFSKDMLDKYTGSDPAYGIRAEVLTALCYVIGTFEPFRYLLEPLNSDVLNPEDQDLIELARLTEQRKALDQKITQLQTRRGLK